MLHLIDDFGTFSGLQIIWDKSQILPLDLGAPSSDQALLPLLSRTSQIKYLGVYVSCSPQELSLNVEPLYDFIKAKTQIWYRLPLGVMGHINLVKMILLPKILYVFWHAPSYIPLRTFKSMDSIINSFIWGK